MHFNKKLLFCPFTLSEVTRLYFRRKRVTGYRSNVRKKRIVTVCLKLELQDFFVLSLLGGGGGGGGGWVCVRVMEGWGGGGRGIKCPRDDQD